MVVDVLLLVVFDFDFFIVVDVCSWIVWEIGVVILVIDVVNSFLLRELIDKIVVKR